VIQQSNRASHHDAQERGNLQEHLVTRIGDIRFTDALQHRIYVKRHVLNGLGKQKRSKLADTSSLALPTAPKLVGGKAVAVVLNLFMALLSFRGISTPSLQAQGEQRRLTISTLDGTIPDSTAGYGKCL
jgi:hypothetical protein